MIIIGISALLVQIHCTNVEETTYVGLIVYCECVNIFPDILGRHPSQSRSSSFWNVSEAKGLPGG